jgi:nicotinate-nucleotide adenylyltransferase
MTPHDDGEAAPRGAVRTDSPHPVVRGSIGVLGGTFDPVHVGHLVIAEEVREALGLERVLFVPAGIPPHKPGRPITPAEDRVAMVELAIAGNATFELSRLEVDRPGPSYAVDTLELIAAQARVGGREPDITFILSAEAFVELPTWRDPARLLSLCRMAVVPRSGPGAPGAAWLHEHIPGQEARVLFLDGPNVDLSATRLRERVAVGRSIRYLVPEAVIAYIADHALYRPESWRNDRP